MIYPVTAALIGLVLAGSIFWLLRRNHLYVRSAFFWLLVATAALLFAVFPRWMDAIGSWLGISYPPALMLGAAVAVVTVKALLADVAMTQLRSDVRRLNQRIALLEQAASPTKDDE